MHRFPDGLFGCEVHNTVNWFASILFGFEEIIQSRQVKYVEVQAL